MKVGIIGAGFTGLSAGYYLSKAGVDVEILESEDNPGGLAVGFKQKNWDWTLEQHYHHWFTNDESILSLAKEIGQPVEVIRPKTSVYRNNTIFQLDSSVSLLKVPGLTLVDKLRAGLTLFFLKYLTPWQVLEGVASEKFLKTTMGKKSWEVLWQPLFKGKFGKYSDKIPASWFWARIKKRTSSLAYPEGGFLRFAENLEKKITDLGGKINYNVPVKSIEAKDKKIVLVVNGKRKTFDKVICTLPTPIYLKLVKGLPKTYVNQLKPLKGIGAINVVLTLKNKFLEDGTYWLNINEEDFPFLAVVEHTSFMSKKNYGNENIIYVGNYLPTDHKYFDHSSNRLLKEFMPYLKKINKQFNDKQIISSYVFKARFAQPIIPLNYSKTLPNMETPVDSLYLANMQMVYPWDRGTNYAVELGKKVADKIISS